MRNNKQISIVIATYNASETISQCLDSIIYQLTEKCELIIIDGNSSDKTLEILNKYSNHIDYFLSESDDGIYDAWNKGIQHSNGEWIMFLGADDILLPNAICNYLSLICSDRKEEVDYICGQNQLIDKTGKIIKVFGLEPLWDKFRKYNVVAHVASIHNKKTLFNEIGLYSLEFEICGDYELLLRKKDKLKYLYIKNQICKMGVGGKSFSSKAIIESYKIRSYHKSISFLSNIIVLFYNLNAFYFFKLRKKIGGASF